MSSLFDGISISNHSRLMNPSQLGSNEWLPLASHSSTSALANRLLTLRLDDSNSRMRTTCVGRYCSVMGFSVESEMKLASTVLPDWGIKDKHGQCSVGTRLRVPVIYLTRANHYHLNLVHD